MATIKDIARVANVSIATVSMALNDKDCITKKTKDKVLKVARELNYTPSIAAKTLKTNRTNTISLLIGDIANPFFPELIKGVEKSAREHDYNVLIFDLSGREEVVADEIKKSLSQRVDGLFITGAYPVTEETMDKLHLMCDEGLKMITCNRFMVSDRMPIIFADERPEIENLLCRMVAFGHKHIGCISGKKGYWVTNEREQSFKKTLEQFELYHPEYIINTGFEFDNGRKATRELLTAHPEITALMCINDTLAIGSATEAKAMGYSIPEDLSVFGVDGIEYLRYYSPEITTVNTHRYDYGYVGTERLIKMIESGDHMDPVLLENIFYPCSIATGATITAPRKRVIG